MSKYKNMLLGAAMCLTFGAPVMAQDVTGQTVVATVGGTDITVGHMVAMTLSLPEEQRSLPMDVIFEGLLERLIQQEAVSQSQTDLTRRTELQLENEQRSLVASEIVNAMAEKITVTDGDVQAAYDIRFADFMPQTEYNASHILVETEEEAKAIIAELEAGADFADTAKEKSTGPSGPSGGELGWFGPGRMVPDFEAAVVEMEKDGISAPVQTQFGWHVIKLNDSRQPGVPTLEEMKSTLEQEAWRNMMTAEIDALVGQVEIVRADVSGINPEVLTDPAMMDD